MRIMIIMQVQVNLRMVQEVRDGIHPIFVVERLDCFMHSGIKKKKLREGWKPKPPKPIGTVMLSESKKEQIQELLKTTSSVFEKDDSTGFAFQEKFLKMITGNIEDKLNRAVAVKHNETIDLNLYNEFQIRKADNCFKEMQQKRQSLPSFKKREEILKLINENQVVVISGETGCGKTTQVAQFILDDFVEKRKGSLCHIVCTQPRRISAISVAERVAEERAEPLGVGVGYRIRLEKQLPREKGSIVFCTTGVVLKLMEGDPCLSDVSHVILDEIHERDIMSDFLLTLLKEIIKKRRDLKVILMSATLNSEKFSNYYGNCPHINIPGFTYPVQEFYIEDVIQRTGFKFDDFANARGGKRQQYRKENNYINFIQPYVIQLEAENSYSRDVCIQLRNPKVEELNLDLIVALLIDICEKENDKGAVLIFVPGFAQISSVNNLMTQSGKFPAYKFLIIPLHSRMASVNQRQVFERPPKGVRKIIIATNIAETSITIDDVVFVIDGGRVKMTNFDIRTNTQTLKSEWVSLANANQRRGRAGRVQPGICFHLFTRARNRVLEEYQKPEILRNRLENTILTIKLLQLGDVEDFMNRLMDSPDPEAVRISLNLLKRLNALDQSETLTPLGYHLGKLPMGPQVGKMILLAAIFSCVDPVLSIAASLDFKDAFQLPLGKEREADHKRRELSNGCKSDHLLLHIALERFENEDNPRQFCWEYFLSWHILSQLQSMKNQFMEYLYELDFVNSKNPQDPCLNVNSDNQSLVKAVICAGLYPNVGTIRVAKKFRTKVHLIEGERAEMHPKSILCREVNFDSPLFVYHLKLRSTSTFIHDATLVHPLPIIFFGDNYNYNVAEEGSSTISIGSDRLRFKCSKSTNTLINELRNRLNWFLEYKINNPGTVNWNNDGPDIAVLRAVMELITSEDLGDIDLEAYDDDD